MEEHVPMIKRSIHASLLAGCLGLAALSMAAFAETASPPGAKVYFIAPADGAEISGPVVVQFGLTGMGVAPAGVEKDKTGHHHLLIDQKLADYTAPIPADDHHKHFGGGQTETTLTLPAGKHTLQLILADQNHIPHKPPVESEVINITVK
jgi:hypothetical protein